MAHQQHGKRRGVVTDALHHAVVDLSNASIRFPKDSVWEAYVPSVEESTCF